MSKKFVYWYFILAGITGSVIAITGICSLVFFQPATESHLSVLGYLFLAAFTCVLVFSGYVLSQRNQFRGGKPEGEQAGE
jgi:hypothetical protein